MNTVQQLEKFINDPSSTRHDQLIRFIQYAGQTQTAPTISMQDQKFTSSFTATDNQDSMEQSIIQTFRQQNAAISVERISTLLSVDQNAQVSLNDRFLPQITSAFDTLQLNYLQYQKKQYGIIKRPFQEGLAPINDAFAK